MNNLIYAVFFNTISFMEKELKKQNISKKKIINSAIVLFANKGFDSTSTREICKHAGVNLGLIPYYFGSKSGLYSNIVESIINYGLSTMQEELDNVKNLKLMTKEDKIRLYRALLEKYVDFLYSDNVPNSFIILMIKEQTISNTQFSEIYVQKISILYSALRKILASILSKKETDKMIILEVSSIIGQILGYKVLEKSTLKALNQDFYTKDDCKKIKNLIFSYVDTCINALG